MKYKHKKAPEGINSNIESPLSDAFFLTGLTGAVVVVGFFALGIFTNMVVKKIDLATEAKYFQKENKKDLSKEAEEIRTLVDKLWANYPESKEMGISTSVNPSKQMNAFMSIGGNMAVTQGLIDKLKYENELAFVICHELGHFYNRDVLQGMGRQLGMAFFLSSIGLNDSVDLVSLSASSISLAFDRKQESEADAFAIDCMSREYGHVQGFDEFFNLALKEENKVLPKSGKKVLSFMQSHPMTEKRIDNLKALIKEKSFPETGKLNRLKFK